MEFLLMLFKMIHHGVCVKIKFDDVKKCNGDKITPKIVNVRDFGELNNIVW